jgi:hypothetical protein
MTEVAVPDPMIDEDTMVSRNPKLLVAAVHDETVMMDIDSGKYYGLDDIGTAIWQRLERPLPFGKLVEMLAAEYDAERATIARDVAKLLTSMAEHKAIDLS